MRNPERYIFGAYIRQLRKERIGSQKDFAHMLGVSSAYICEVETKGILPSRELMTKMANILKVQLGPLLIKSQAQKLRNFKEKEARREELKRDQCS